MPVKVLTACRLGRGALSSSGQACTALLAAGSIGADVVGAALALNTGQGHLAVSTLGGHAAKTGLGEALQQRVEKTMQQKMSNSSVDATEQA
jgi:hypothetical protein